MVNYFGNQDPAKGICNCSINTNHVKHNFLWVHLHHLDLQVSLERFYKVTINNFVLEHLYIVGVSTRGSGSTLLTYRGEEIGANHDTT